jgi:hypothetical protein
MRIYVVTWKGWFFQDPAMNKSCMAFAAPGDEAREVVVPVGMKSLVFLSAAD